jgi:hypothetical protein
MYYPRHRLLSGAEFPEYLLVIGGVRYEVNSTRQYQIFVTGGFHHHNDYPPFSLQGSIAKANESTQQRSWAHNLSDI